MKGRSVFFSLLCVCLLYVTPAAAELYCPGSPFKNGPEDPGVGPYDYYDVQAQRQPHFSLMSVILASGAGKV